MTTNVFTSSSPSTSITNAQNSGSNAPQSAGTVQPQAPTPTQQTAASSYVDNIYSGGPIGQ